MVAPGTIIRRARCALREGPKPRSRIRMLGRRAILSLAATLVIGYAGWAQDLTNTGTIANTGTIKVKNQASGLPAVVNGVFEYFGANQTVMARQYQSLVLSGSGTKTTSGGNVIVGDTLTIAPSVTLATGSTLKVTLLGRLEEQGYFLGTINKTVDLSGATTSSDFGNVGASISWTGTAPGTTIMERTSGVAATGNGNQSVLRYYDIAPTFGSNLNGTLTFRYSTNELNGKDPNALELWRSPDGGATWRRQGGTVLPGLNTIVKTGIVGFSRWTATDTTSLLGPAAYEWVASTIATFSGDGQSASTGSALAPFVVNITDFYGNPISGVTVTFAIQSTPLGATGQSLSTTAAVTDANGQASTVLTLGNQNGAYSVQASSGSLTGTPRTFSATATSVAAAMVLSSGNAQADTIDATLVPFAVRVNDMGGNSVPGITVNFAITSRPAGEAGSALSNASALTNGLGIATTTLRLGNKVGVYVVTATTPALPSVQVPLSATATHGTAAALVMSGGSTIQQDTILTALDTLFVARIEDTGGNAVPNAPVVFAITGAPAGATGQGLTNSNGLTDSSGLASTRLTLGSKVGTYQVTAASGGLTNSPLTFTAQALRGAAALFTEAAGVGQQRPVTSVLDSAFTVSITDIGGNAVPGIPVQFVVASVPSGAVGYSLSRTVDTTDASGNASTTLTLGTKVGSYRVEATTIALSDTAAFTAQAASGAAAQLLATSGDGQIGVASAVLPQPLVITVHDAFANPVQGATIQFTVTSAPASATGQQITSASAVTDSLGQAFATLRLGSMPGNYVVTANVSGAPPAQFTATALFILADVNNDFGVDIADLTSVVDHILGKRVLTGIDSAKADANADGAINVLDIVRIQNSILGTVTLPKQASGMIPASVAKALATVTGELEITPVGVRFNLTNDIPIKGLQLMVALNAPASVSKTDVVFTRARAMDFFVNSQGQEVKLVAYNLENQPIDTGSGSVVRLPLKLVDSTEVDSVYAIISVGDSTFDVALRVQVTLKQSIYPLAFRLLQNYPNPFNSETKIEFEVPDVEGKLVRALVQVFNLVGEKVKTLTRGEHGAGHYTVTWDGTDDSGLKVPSGVYFYRLVSTDYVTAKKMIMIK